MKTFLGILIDLDCQDTSEFSMGSDIPKIHVIGGSHYSAALFRMLQSWVGQSNLEPNNFKTYLDMNRIDFHF